MRIIELTEACNHDCEYCYLGVKNGKRMRFKTAYKFITEYKGHEIGLSGGETLMHPYINKIIEAGLNEGKYICIATNGSIYRPLPKEVSLIISLPAIDDTLYREITKGNLNMVVRNIKQYKEEEKRITLNCVVYGKNKEHARKVAEFAYKEGIGFRLTRAVRTKRNKNFREVSEDEFRKIFSEIKLFYNSMAETGGIRECDSCSLETINVSGIQVGCRLSQKQLNKNDFNEV